MKAEGARLREVAEMRDAEEQKLNTLRVRETEKIRVKPANGNPFVPDAMGNFYPVEGVEVDANSPWVHRRLRDKSLILEGATPQPEEQPVGGQEASPAPGVPSTGETAPTAPVAPAEGQSETEAGTEPAE
jgi:hypothetical protein